MAWWYTTIGFSAPRAPKFLRSSSRTTCAVEPCASQPAPDSALDSVSASGAAANATSSHSDDHGPAVTGHGRGQPGEQCPFVGRLRRLVFEEQRLERRDVHGRFLLAILQIPPGVLNDTRYIPL